MKFSKFIFPLGLLLLAGAFIWWLFSPSQTPGRAVPQLSREHIKDTDPNPTYNSNPPSSGPHSEVWTPSGFYETEKSDRNLLHSLEHGYVIVSYNCQVKERASGIKYQGAEVWAHGEEMAPEASAAAGPASAAITADEACHRLRDSLKDLVKEYKEWKIIAVPRSTLDTRIALTAWGRIDKFNNFDRSRIDSFIKAFRDRGPEATKD